MALCTSVTKGLFYLFNFIFWLTGLGLLVLGILSKYAFSYMLKLSTDINYNLAPYIMIACGVFIVLVGFIGCWGAIKEHGWALKLYMFVLVILVVVEFAGSIAGYVMRNKLSHGLESGMENAVAKYYEDAELKEAMDKIQSEVIKCCGVRGPQDYVFNAGNSTQDNSTQDNSTTITEYKVPKSCCQVEAGCKFDQVITDINGSGFYTHGCYNELLSKTKSNFLVVGGTALGIAIFQIFGILCAYSLTRQFNTLYNEF